MWVTSRTGSVGWDLRKVSWVPASEEDGWLSELAEALRWLLHVVWGRWKSQQRKGVYLSPYVVKPFNSKVIKKFRTWTKKSWVFFFFCVSGFLCYLYVRYEPYERFAYRYEYVYFTYSYLAMLQSHTIRLFRAISIKILEGVLLLCGDAVGEFYSISRLSYIYIDSHNILRWLKSFKGDVKATVLDCGLKGSEFDIQSYNVDFRINTLVKGMKPFIAPTMD